MLDLINSHKLRHIDRVFILEEVTDFLEVLKSLIRAVEDNMVHNVHQMLVQVAAVLSLLVPQEGSQLVEVF